MACNLNKAGRTATRDEIWDSGLLVDQIADSFDILIFKVTVVIWCICLKIACNSKIARRSVNGTEFGPWRH